MTVTILAATLQQELEALIREVEEIQRALLLAGNRVGESEPAKTLGTVVGKYPVYDSEGELVGYVPVYDKIT